PTIQPSAPLLNHFPLYETSRYSLGSQSYPHCFPLVVNLHERYFVISYPKLSEVLSLAYTK
ncbi:MAG: hypothetical protein QXT76_02480, partial [Sulfolobales archaeon]